MTVGPIVLPKLDWAPTKAHGSRAPGDHVTRVVVHRWGVRYTTEKAEGSSYHGVITYFEDPTHDASAHIVFPGSAVAGKATQMVAWDDYAWTQAAFNRTSDDIECADAIWLGHDPHGMQTLARIVAMRLHARGLPAIWSKERGFCRHADLGAAGGGHTSCPVANDHLSLWRVFASMVHHEAARGGFRAVWGR